MTPKRIFSSILDIVTVGGILFFVFTACSEDSSSGRTYPDEWDLEEPDPYPSLDHFFDEEEDDDKEDSLSKKSSSSTDAESSSSSVLFDGPNTKISYGELTDDRDDQTYRTVSIGSQIWMAENLNFDDMESTCYRNKVTHCAEYGRLYTWKNANSACPEGWVLPSNDSWDSLLTHVGEDAAQKLKSAYDWNEGAGTDEYGFTILPAGYIKDSSYVELYEYASFWSSDEFDSTSAYSWRVASTANDIKKTSFSKTIARSVRCLKKIIIPVEESSSSADIEAESSSAETAETSSAAASSAATATSSASTVKTSTSTAASSAATAVSSAATATSSASAVKTSTSTAASSATTAVSSATTAKSSASTIKTSTSTAASSTTSAAPVATESSASITTEAISSSESSI